MRQVWERQVQLAVPVVLRRVIVCHQQAAAVCCSLAVLHTQHHVMQSLC